MMENRERLWIPTYYLANPPPYTLVSRLLLLRLRFNFYVTDGLPDYANTCRVAKQPQPHM